MEYIDGVSLKQYLRKKKKPLPENAVLSIMRPILYALSNIHKEGMIHRDVSPENIMLAKDGRVVLIDFGAARNLTGAETQSLTIILKQGYAPVEQYQTRGRQGPWSDVYAVYTRSRVYAFWKCSGRSCRTYVEGYGTAVVSAYME